MWLFMVYSFSSESSRQQAIETQTRNIGAPSSFARVNEWMRVQTKLTNKGFPLNCHRPADMYGTDVSLLYHDFDTFVCDCESLSLDKEDTMFTVQFTIAMSAHFFSEPDRRDKVQELLGIYLAGHRVHSVENMDGAVMFGDAAALIWEIKNEVGTGGCDSYLELIAHYVKAVAKMVNKDKCPAPSFLMEIVGTHMAIYGAVYTNTACTDRLTHCLWLAFQPNNPHAMAQLARTFKALKLALGRLKEYYSKLPTVADTQIEFPCFRKFEDETSQQQQTEITYTAEIKNRVFRATTNMGKKVIVKFVEKYGHDAHKACADDGFAPQLLSVKQVTSRYKMVVMEDLENATQLDMYIVQNPSCKDQLLQRCKYVLGKLHDRGFCHGDFRPNNVMVVPDHDIKVIDFDWAGRTNEDTYPLFMNHIDRKWHETASDGKVLRKEHDLYWLSHM